MSDWKPIGVAPPDSARYPIRYLAKAISYLKEWLTADRDAVALTRVDVELVLDAATCLLEAVERVQVQACYDDLLLETAQADIVAITKRDMVLALAKRIVDADLVKTETWKNAEEMRTYYRATLNVFKPENL